MSGREVEAVTAVLERGDLADGDAVRAFEREFASFHEAAHGVATSNGTTALHAALHALGIGSSDRVLTTPFSFVATVNAVRLCGATPVFADVDPETCNLDPARVASRVAADDVDAILAVHLYGLPARVADLRDIADDHGIPLIEDAAQAHGATVDGRPVGSFGDAASFSFYPTKNMTTGEGGMVLTDRDDIATRAARFVNHGRTAAGAHATVGHNFRLTNVAAAIGRVQLEKLPRYTDARRANAAYLTDALAEAAVETPTDPPDRRHVYHQYTVRCSDRAGLRAHLDDAGVDTGIYYDPPIHREPAYDHVTHDAPVAERLAEEVLSLPVHPGLTETDLETVATTINTYSKQ